MRFTVLPANTPAPAWLARADHRLASLGLACGALLLATYTLAVHTEWGQRAENAALAGRFHQPPPIIDGSRDLLNTISVLSLAGVGGSLCLLGLARGGWSLGIGVGITILGANVTTQVLKRVVLDRPDLLANTPDAIAHNSLPSGHATVAMTIAVAAMMVTPPRYRPWFAAITGVYAASVGAATISAGWHRPSDAIAAAFVAVGWGAAVSAGLILFRQRTPMRPATSSNFARLREAHLRDLIVISSGVLVTALGTLSLVVLRESIDDLTDVRITGAFVSGSLASFAATAVSLGGFGYTLSRLDLAALSERIVDLPGTWDDPQTA